MPVTPLSILSKPVDALRDMVSNCATFQTWVGASGDPATAKGRIYPFLRWDADETAYHNFTRPFALVSFADMITSRGGFARTELSLFFEAAAAYPEIDAANPTTIEDGVYTFANTVGAIIEELWDESEKGGSLLIVEGGIRLSYPPRRVDPKVDEIDAFECEFIVSCGPHGPEGGIG